MNPTSIELVPAAVTPRLLQGRAAAIAAAAIALAWGAAAPAQAQPPFCHPAATAACEAPHIDPNTFLVGHPASPTTRAGHANFDHPAVVVARNAARPGIDPNTFLVQPPVAVTWLARPEADDATRFAAAPDATAALRH
jgi:hypothetical protein